MPDFFHVSALSAQADDSLLRFSIDDGDLRNEFLRQGPVAAHMLFSSGNEPRLIVAFPAGNSAIGLWSETEAERRQWDPIAGLHAVCGRDAAGRPLYGVRGEVTLHGGALRVRDVVLSSARVLRNFGGDGRLPAGVAPALRLDRAGAHWSRDRLDGAAGYALSIALLSGTCEADGAGGVRLVPDKGGVLRMVVTALCGEPPLTPMSPAQLLLRPYAGDPRTRNTLAFLSYEEKLLAGSWRFNTYFGRDTLMSLALLMPVLTPRAVEAALGAVLGRLGAGGDVAHEEAIGEFAVLHSQARGAVSDHPVYDYKMVDDDFMLAPVMAAYLAGRGESEARDFLARRTVAGPSYRELFLSNIRLVLDKAAPFAKAPRADRLVALKPGRATGDWRDSADGLGGGTLSYSVNAVLVPAALRAIDQLERSGLLGDADELAAPGTAARFAAQWEQHAGALFDVEFSATATRAAVAAHAAELGIDPQAALDSLADGPQRFSAVALEADGQPVPVLHSDFGFAMLLQAPPAALIERELAALMRPFPAGLMTEVGLLVANGAMAAPARRARFGPDRYHGAVVWSWQQALFAAGLARQRRRADLPPSTRQALAGAERALWQAIGATRAQGNSELWSWTYRDGRFRMYPFGPTSATADEANAAQLWSTAYLAVLPPAEAA